MTSDGNGWDEWNKHVLIELKRLNLDIKDVNKSLKNIEIEIAMLKVKSSFWGAMGAGVTILVYMAASKFLGG
jgi:hypothetical protein